MTMNESGLGAEAQVHARDSTLLQRAPAVYHLIIFQV